MNTLVLALKSYSTESICILDTTISLEAYVPLDLSKYNDDLIDLDITDHAVCQTYIDSVLKTKQGVIAYGGYLEQRNLYNDKEGFTSSNKPVRNIHLGIDFWCDAGTKVITPLDGKVHSFKNNTTIGDYGPTIILEHVLNDITFYTLYGHLAVDSLSGLYIGKDFKAGDVLANLGTPDININYAPHLHFQIIQDLKGNEGDYPGVCAEGQLSFYKENCPDPNALLKLGVV
ncbi:peptidase M23-like protein [Maribacter spongiicola]|uniref:Peptidase M23-like protein n=1 Tax=Maribacter spongiicola TaxID=1206753 RepID=A0A4R7K985_9FLAO|nr:peptidoglycan DD-metalloendopeptidase family protein [Maribacter spongiicola]TDT47531.1 peptidase M23-like protein [Maribacter spongiicola]